MRILVIGGEGQLGDSLIRKLVRKHEVVTTYNNRFILSECRSYKADITTSKISKVILKEKPEVIINCAAITSVDYCEQNQEHAYKVNVKGVNNIINAAKKVNAHLIQVSTTFVYEDNGKEHFEDEELKPVNYYGETKKQAEKLVIKSGLDYTIVRPDQLFSWFPPRNNFVKHVLNSIDKGIIVNAATDIINQPTLTDNLADMIIELAEKKVKGVYNTTGRDFINRYDWALMITEIFNKQKDLVKAVKSDELNLIAKRPSIKVSLKKISETVNVKPLSLSEALILMRKEIDGLHIKKGVILAGGQGTRLYPATKVTNKHLLAVYDKPMIYYPLRTLINAGISRILIISGGNKIGDFTNLLKSGEEFGVELTYKVQNKAGGIAQAVGLAEEFAGNDPFAVILGDNYYEEDLKECLRSFNKGARIILKEVSDPERFGVATIKDNKVVRIIEKPVNPETNLAVTGFYLYDKRVFGTIKKLKPSSRGELEITDVNNAYIKMNELSYHITNGFWSDMGTPDSLLRTSSFIKEKISKTV